MARRARWAALVVLAFGPGCREGSASSPTHASADGSAPQGAPDDATTGDATTDGDDGATGGDDGPAHGPYEGGLAWDGCAATGTCPPPTSRVLASGQATPAGIVLSGTSVYWVNLGMLAPDGGPRVGSQIVTCAKTGCGGSPLVLATGSWDGMSELAVDDTDVYWLVTGQVLACPLAGCSGSPRVVWSGTGPLYDIVADDAGVYFTAPSLGELLSCPGGACDGGPGILWPPAQVDGSTQFGGGAATGIALDATSVYFIVSPFVFACEKRDCAGTLRRAASLPTSTPAQIAVDGQNLYVTDFQSGAAGGILSGPKGGVDQPLGALVRGLSLPTSLATDGTNAFFAEEGNVATATLSGQGRVAECAAGGCGDQPGPVADFVNCPLGVAVDGTDVFWTDFGPGTDRTQTDAGRVMMRPKP
jgi:hypothetical protein